MRERVSTPGVLGALDDVVRSGRLASVFGRLHLDAFTGVVFAENTEQAGVFSFRAGNPVFAEIPDEVPIGDLLLDRGLIDQTRYTEIAAATAGAVETSDDVAFCDQAVALGVLSRDQVDTELSRRVRGRVIEATAWEGCRIEIDGSPDALTGIREYPQVLGPLLYMGVRTFYDEARIGALLGDTGSVFVRLTRPVGRISDFLDLDAQERSLLERIDPGTPVAPLVAESGIDTVEAWQLLCVLVIAGMAETAAQSFAPAPGVERSGVLDRPDRDGGVHAGASALPPPESDHMFAVREEVGRRTVDRMPVVDEGTASRAARVEGRVDAPRRDAAVAQGTRPAPEPLVDDQPTRRLPRGPGVTRPSAAGGAGMRKADVRRPPPATGGAEREPGAPASPVAIERAPTERVPSQDMRAIAEGGAPSERRAPPRRPTTAVERLGRELERRRPPSPPPPAPDAPSHVKQLLARRHHVEQQGRVQERTSADELLRQALELMRDQHFVRALPLLRECCQFAPTNHAYRMYRLWAEMRSPGASDDLRVEMRQLLREHMENEAHKGFVHYALGFMALQDGKEEAAERHFKKASAADKSNKDAERHLRILERRREAAQQKQKK